MSYMMRIFSMMMILINGESSEKSWLFFNNNWYFIDNNRCLLDNKNKAWEIARRHYNKER